MSSLPSLLKWIRTLEESNRSEAKIHKEDSTLHGVYLEFANEKRVWARDLEQLLNDLG